MNICPICNEGGFGTLPRAGVWMLIFMVASALVVIAVFPFILRKRRQRARREIEERVRSAMDKILADGRVEGPKGPYVRHIPWNAGTDASTPMHGHPRPKAYRGTEWP
ncbi:MAG: hypothetical protein FJ224_05715 [Lentisphaerae bacterium]|nr:hypothetical protein [Lentisphaerota bacterium]